MASAEFDYNNPALAQIAPRMELAKALTAAGTDTSAAYPMQALARLAQGAAGQYIQNGATSDLAKLYAQQAGGMAGALEQAAPGHPLIAALRSGDPGVAAMALRQAGPALVELPKEAESKRRFGVESGMRAAEIELHRKQLEKPEFGQIGINERTGYPERGFIEPLTRKVTPYQPGGAAAPSSAPPIEVSSRNELLRLPPGTRYVAKGDPSQKVRIWEGP